MKLKWVHAVVYCMTLYFVRRQIEEATSSGHIEVVIMTVVAAVEEEDTTTEIVTVVILAEVNYARLTDVSFNSSF